MNEPEHIALFDMDGTLCEYEYQLKHNLQQIASPYEPVIEDIFQEKEYEDYMEERIDLIRSQPNWWRNLLPIHENFELLHICKKIGFDIRILTKGPRKLQISNAWTEKFEWCHDHIVPLVPTLQITVTQDKGMVYGKLLVDDYPDYLERWLEWRPRGLCIMPARKYNKDFKHPNVIRFESGDNLSQVTKALQACFDRQPGETIDYSKF